MSTSTNNVDEQNKLKEDNGYFGLSIRDIVELYDAYQRTEQFDQDVQKALEIGGTEEILTKLRTSFEKGLDLSDKTDISTRIKVFGENKFYQEPMPHCCEYVWEGLEDLMIRILILAAIFQIVVGLIPQIRESENDWIEGISIVFAVVVVVSVGSITNFSKEKKFRELNDKNSDLSDFTVKRNGQVQTIKEEMILVGDIVKIEVGMVLPADGFLIEGNEIKVEEASLTGESDLIEKEPLEYCRLRAEEEIENHRGVRPKEKHLIGSPLVFSGTLVSEGSGWFVALRIGPNSEKGKIQAQVEAEQQKGKGGNKGGKSGEETEGKKDEDVAAGENKKEGENEEKKKEGEEEEDEEEDEDEGKTPLELKLDVLANDVGMFGIAAAVCTLVALVIRLIVTTIEDKIYAETANLYQISNWYNNTVLGEAARERETPSQLKIIVDVIRMIILCIAIIVVAIPEGLPLAVTLSLAFSIGKMMEDNNLVRKMNACETMGGATYICSDKTGTLTKNEMSVEMFYDCGKEREFKQLTSNKENREDPLIHFKDAYYKLFRLALCLNIDVEIDEEEKIVKGSKTDYSFVHLLHNFNEKIYSVREEYFKGEEIKRFPFTSTRKKMSTINSSNVYPRGNIIFLKGASEIVLSSCKSYLDPETCTPQTITDEKIQVYKGVIKNFADRALRTICIAYKDLTNEQVNNWKEKDDKENVIEKDDFVLIGIFGIKDQLRNKVADAVDICQKAGITVVMVTGDNIDTANAIARECHILTDELEKEAKEKNKTISYIGKDFYEKIGGMVCTNNVCKGRDLKFCMCPRTEGQLEQMKAKRQEDGEHEGEELELRCEKISNMEVFKEICKDIRVIARSRPEDKYTMVYGLRELDEVVAVTGDGTNDAPALSKSDVGFAMGVSGTDIAKQAADIIILDDNFATIVQAVKWGRNIYDNIRKFIQFQLTVNICACLLVFLCCCIGKETPLNAIQMLWVNMIMDSLGSLALATEPPNENLLQRKPYPKTEYIINNLMWKHTFYQAMVELAIMLVLYLIGHEFIPETNAYNKAVAQTLLKCYGSIPGQHDFVQPNPNLLISGPTLFWDKKIERLPNATPQDCRVQYLDGNNYADYYNYSNLEEAHKHFLTTSGSAHLTVIFNTFVLYTLLNQINARVIDDSYNIFADIQKNYLFALIILTELGLQAVIVSIGGNAFKVSVTGLDGPQWGICFGLGSITFLVAVLLKPIPFQKCFEALFAILSKFKKEEEEQNKEQDEDQKETELKTKNVVQAEEVRVSSKRESVKNLAKLDSRTELNVDQGRLHQQQSHPHSHHPHAHTNAHQQEGRKPNATLLNLRRPSMVRQATNRGQSKMRSVKEN